MSNNLNEFPESYPNSLRPCSWSINGKFGILPRFNKYCRGIGKESNFFIQNYLQNYFINEINRLRN